MPEIRARVASSNGRRSSNKPDWLIRSRYWPNRRKYLIAALQDVAPSIIGCQEYTAEQAHDVTKGLGPNWTYYGGDGSGKGNVLVMWDGLKWDAIGAPVEVPLPTDNGRWLVAVRLRSRPPKPPGSIWVASVHLTVGDTKAKQEARHKEIRAAIRIVQGLPGHEHSLICGDFNSDSYPGRLGGVRTIAAELGYRGLRDLLDNDELARESYSSFNGWKRTPQDGRWIDDVLTPKAVKPYSASLEFTCLRKYELCGSDHNIIRASVAWQSEETP